MKKKEKSGVLNICFSTAFSYDIKLALLNIKIKLTEKTMYQLNRFYCNFQ